MKVLSSTLKTETDIKQADSPRGFTSLLQIQDNHSDSTDAFQCCHSVTKLESHLTNLALRVRHFSEQILIFLSIWPICIELNTLKNILSS